MNRKRIIVCLVFNIMCALFVEAQNMRTVIPNGGNGYALKSYTTHDGLPSENVTVALKDKQGYIWVGTDNGLCKFDGYTFKNFINVLGDSSSISSNFINALTEDKDGRIWVGTMDGLNVLDPVNGRFQRFYHNENKKGTISNNKIFSVFCDRQGTIWTGTDDGFNQYIKSENTFIVYKPNTGNLFAIKGKSVNAITEDADNNLWLGNWSGGLNKFDKVKKHFISYPQTQLPHQKNPNDIWSLYYDDKRHSIWVGTYWNGLFCFDLKNLHYTSYQSDKDQNKAAFSVGELNDTYLIVGSNAGFYFVNKDNNLWTKIDEINSTADGYVYNDKSGIVWICGEEGLTKLDFTQYKFHFLPLDIKKNDVKSMLLKGSILWLGTVNGLYELDLSNKTTKLFVHTNSPSSLASNQVNKLYLDNEQSLWMATENGFDKFDDRTNTFIHHFHHSALSNLYNEDVFRDILEVNPHQYWLATDAGLKIYNEEKKQFAHYYNEEKNLNSIASNHIYSLLKDKNGDVWIGTDGSGVDRFDPKTQIFHHYIFNDKKKGSLSSNIIKCLFQDSHKNIWIGTADGLNKYIFQTNTFVVYSRKDGFASNVFNNLAEDNNGILWINTATGLSKFDPGTSSVTNFDEGDGVFSHSLIYRTTNNQIYLGGNSGIVFFDPKKIELNKKTPQIYFVDFQVFNKSVQPGPNSPINKMINMADTVTLNYGQSVFSIEFVALNYTHSEKNLYKYMLEGFDKKWNFSGRQRRVTYTNLNPGTYIFKVIGSNNDGFWNQHPKSLTIIITPPWYLTWWAYTLYLIAVVGLIYAYQSYKSRQAKMKYEIQIAHFESEKEKELTKKKESFFTNISHEFRTPLTLIINPVKELLYGEKKEADSSTLAIVYRNARRLLSLVDQLLLFKKAESESDQLRLSNLNIIDLCKEVYLCFTHEAKRKNILFEFLSSGDCLNIIADREKIEIALFNLLSNAIKFTPAQGIIKVTIEDLEERVSVKIQDSGCGIPTEVGEKLFDRFYQVSEGSGNSPGGFGIGLYLVKTFVERHGGSIDYQSEVNKGTTFTITLRKGSSHLKDPIYLEHPSTNSVFLKELIESEIATNTLVAVANYSCDDQAASDFKSLLIIDDNEDMREYLRQLFNLEYNVFTANSGEDGLKILNEQWPDIVICDVMMQGITGIEVCSAIKENMTTAHIPVILLTASASAEIRLKGIEGGADDYLGKPFDKNILKARVHGLLKSKNTLQQYFYNEITLNNNPHKVSIEYKTFLESCIKIIEQHLTDADFNLQVLASELNLSYSSISKKIKMISGQPANNFVRAIRLRRAAQLFVHSDLNIIETADAVGIRDIKYFREQFKKLFDLTPSQYIKRFRKNFKSDMVNRDPDSKKTHKGIYI